MKTQSEKAATFQALHERKRPFVVGNPWDAGSARILTSLKYEALSTTSAGLAFSLGRKDGTAAGQRRSRMRRAS
jgi:2-methylisocitrate lyase-like PEP mutase family enzyme